MRSSGHAGSLMYELLTGHPEREDGELVLVLEYLPSYAPELDPVEGLWAN